MEAMSGVPWGIIILCFVVFLVAVAVLAFLMPFFVFRIRNEMIKLNGQVHTAEKLLIVQSEQLDSVIQILKAQAKILLKQLKQ